LTASTGDGTSHYKPYPAYKDSGVEWIGKVPEHWIVSPFKWQIERNDSGVWGVDPDGTDDTIVLRSTEQTADGKWRINDPARRKLSTAERNAALLAEGDLVVTRSSSALHVGKTTIVTPEIAAMGCCCANFMQRIRVRPSFKSMLAWYVMNSDIVRLQFDLLSNSTAGFVNLNGPTIGQVLLAIPPVSEQTAIVSFLNRETARIDVLIAKKTEFIELLAKKRQALITHAVTKGLDPNVKMKDSGVEWIGKVPEGWEVKRLRHVAAFKSSNVDKKAYDGQEAVSLCNYTDVYHNEFITLNLPFMQATASPTEIEQFSLKKGDVIITQDSEEPSDIGIPSLVKEEMPGIVCGDHLAMIRGADFEMARFLHRIIQSHPTRAYFFVEALGITRYGLSREAIGDLRFCLPPQNEREAIADYLDSETARIDTLIAKVQLGIDLLKERRSALIVAAVTGKIDLREST